VSAVPGHVPAVTGEVAASPGRAPVGRLVKTVRVSALMTVLGAACLIAGAQLAGRRPTARRRCSHTEPGPRGR